MSKPNPQPNLLDKLLFSLGSPGRFQVIIFILLCTNAYPITFNFIFMTWFRKAPTHHCQIISNETYNDTTIFKFIPNDTDYNKKCKLYINPENHTAGVKTCSVYTYAEGHDTTVSTEWDLVCDKKDLATTAATIFFAGVMIGGLLFGTLADKFGRKPIVLITLYGQALLGIGIAFSPNYLTFVILKFVQGALLQGLQSSNNSLVMEMFPLRYRTIAGMILAMCATSGHMMLAGFFYLIPYWNWMQLTISLMTTITITYTWLFPESIRWLLSQNKENRALYTIQRIAKCNKIQLAQNMPQQLAEISDDIAAKASNVTKYDFRDLFRTSRIRRYTLSLLFCWLSASITYYGIQFYLPEMEQRYWNLFASGAAETAARLVGYFIIGHFGRKKPLIFFYTMSGLFCVATGLVKHFDSNLVLLSNILTILGKLCSSQCFAFNGIYASEIFPTVVRTIGLGAVACFARIGAMLAPQILHLKEYSYLWVPFVIFGSLSFLSAINIFFLPETLNVPLPNTIEDVETNSRLTETSINKDTKVEDNANEYKANSFDNPSFDTTEDKKEKENGAMDHKNTADDESIENERL